jgi:ParB-like chromosome segregation protein Spo0J
MKIYCKYTKEISVLKLEPHPKNPNTHPPEQIKLLAKIIEKHGWRRPIVASSRTGKNVIIKGHGRFEAAQYLCLKKVPVDIQHYESEQDELEDLVADNRLAELVDVDLEKLKEAFQDIDTQLFETGYTEGEIESIINNIEIDEKDLVLERQVDVDPSAAKGQNSLVLHYMAEEADLLIPTLEFLQKLYNCRNTSMTILTILKNNTNG